MQDARGFFFMSIVFCFSLFWLLVCLCCLFVSFGLFLGLCVFFSVVLLLVCFSFGFWLFYRFCLWLLSIYRYVSVPEIWCAKSAAAGCISVSGIDPAVSRRQRDIGSIAAWEWDLADPEASPISDDPVDVVPSLDS